MAGINKNIGTTVSIELRQVNGKYILDARGYACPYPQVLTLRALKEVSPGSIIEVIVDNPLSRQNVPNAVKKAGHEVVDLIDENGHWRIVIRKR